MGARLLSRAVRFAVVGLEHPHAYGITLALLGAGADLVGFHSDNEMAAEQFATLFADATRHDSIEQLLAADIELVVPVGVPGDRAAVAAAAMRAGHDVLADKPAVTTVEQVDELRRAQAETRRVFAVYFSERFESRATVRAGRLVADGAIGQVVHISGMGPHRLGIRGRPPWFFEPDRQGGILADLASHQIDQALHFAGVDRAPAVDVEILTAMVANLAHPAQPALEDIGEIHLRIGRATAHIRVDWFTPDGLDTWGDVRLFVVGTEGYLEIRKNIDIGGRVGGEHLLLVDGADTRRWDCQHDPLPFADQLLADLRDRTDTHMDQQHCFRVCELAVRAQAGAVRRGHLPAARA